MPENVTIVDTPPPAAQPKPTTTINASSLPTTATPPSPPKAGSARERLFKALETKAGVTEPQSSQDAPQTPSSAKNAPSTETPKAAEAPKAAADRPGAQDQPTTPSQENQTPTDQTPQPSDGKKVSPWRLVDQWKGKAADLEKQLAEFKASSDKPNSELLTKLESLQKRNQELEKEMEFVNYEKTPDFKAKYDAPYQKAWQDAISELGELTITDPASGNTRPVQAQDILDLVNLPLAKAREVASTLYGDFADDVMAHRKEIKRLFAERSSAIENARKAGAERDTAKTELAQKQKAETDTLIKSTWEKANQEAVTDQKFGRFFSPVEGDQEGNARLARGYQLVDAALAKNPFDPSLTPEQRSSVVRQHAAIRNRAAAFGRLVSMLGKSESRIAELEKELSGFKASTPKTESASAGSTSTQPPGELHGWDRIRAGLQAKAH